MAIAYFEHIVDEGVTTLGQVAMAGKLTFMNYFPHELHETGNEESVEFYFHIYNLLGDPELNFWKTAPEDLVVDGLDDIHSGTNFLTVSVEDLAGEFPLQDARLGVVQNGQVLGCAYSDVGGMFHLPLKAPIVDGEVQITVTAGGYTPYSQSFAMGQASDLLSALETDPLTGEPGEVLNLGVLLRNEGSDDTGAMDVTLAAEAGGVDIDQNTASLPALDPGASAWTDDDFEVELHFGLEDGLFLPFRIDGPGLDGSARFGLTVSAPRINVAAVNVDGDGLADPGETKELVLDLSNVGSAGTEGGVGTIQLNTPGGGSVGNGMVDFGAIAAGETTSNLAEPFVITVGETVAKGSGLDFTLVLETVEGHNLTTSFGLVVGEMGVGSPVGPDAYGYYAYDSADIDYPGQVPVYNWHTLSPRYGGAGTELDFPSDRYPDQGATTLLVDLPFTFQYYGQDFDQIRVSDNGWFSFDPSDFFDFYNWGMPNSHGNHSIVAPFWDNFIVDPGDEIPSDWDFRDGIYVQHVAEKGAFIVEWSQMRHYRNEIDDFQTFQVWILDSSMHGSGPMGDGEMLFNYRQVANTDYLRNYATVGFESPDENKGLQLSYGNVYTEGSLPVSPGLSIRVSTEPPVYDPLTLAVGKVWRRSEGWRLEWAPADDRPVIGWRVYRNSELIATLPAGAREYVDTHGYEGAEYRLIALHPFGQETDLGLLNLIQPGFMALEPALPNPTRAGSWIHFSLGQNGPANMSVFDVSGRRVRTLLAGEAAEGAASLFWDGRDEAGRELASGVYFYRLQAGERSLTRKLVLIR